MTQQETFDKVVKGILAQNGKFAYAEDRCFYRLIDDEFGILKCAAGHLIPDEKYKVVFDKPKAYLADEAEVASILADEGYDPNFVAQLQDIHDRYAPEFLKWKRKMREFAAFHNLIDTVGEE